MANTATALKETSALPKTRPEDKFIPMARMVEPGVSMRTWVVTVPSDHSWQDIQSPGYWRLVQRRLNIGDQIRVRDECLGWTGELIVLANDPVSMRVEVEELSFKELRAPTLDHQSEMAQFAIENRGLETKWVVLRKTDKHVMRGQFASRSDAEYYVRSELIPRPSR